MANNTSTSGVNQNFELVAPVKILVKPGFIGTGETASLRRRSTTSISLNGTFCGSGTASGRGENENIFLVSGPVCTPRHGESRSEIAIQIENSMSCDNRNVSYYLRHCFRLMYLSGMSTYNTEKRENGEAGNWIDTILRGLQKIFFWLVTSISLLYSGLTLKYFWMIFALNPEVPRLVYTSSWLFTIISEIYYIYLFAFCHKRINEMITTLRKLDSHSIDEVGNGKWKCKNPRKLITVLFIVSIFACFMYPVGRFGIQKWSPNKLLVESSKKLSIKLFIWNKKDLDKNSTKMRMVEEEYGTALTTMTFLIGMTDICMRFCSNMKMDTALNMGIVAAVLIWTRNRYFGKKVKNMEFKNSTNGNDAEELNSPTGLFAEFKQIRKENRILNGLVGGLLKIIHIYNITLCTTFLMRCLDSRATIPELVFLIYDLMKVAVMYYFGKKAAAFNEVYEQWIIDWSMQCTNLVFFGRVTAILHEMKNEPLGLGRGNFLVGQGFIFRFLGFVGSIFMLEVDDDDED